MHEISIAGAIIDSVLDAARKNNANKVTEVFIQIGELTALNPDQLKFIFKTITQGTAAQGACFNISIIKPSIRCKKCSYKGDIEPFERLHFFIPVIKCPQCDETDVDIVAGRECCVQKIKIS
jgi:hydrogenase nickel incorporation protein HypA/HybF